MATRHLFCFGLGYTARALASALDPEAWKVSATYRTKEQAEEMKALGIQPIPFDDVFAGEVTGAYFLSSVPPREEGDPVLDRYSELLQDAEPAWIGYLSTTGVYGDTQGRTVDEAAPLKPTVPRSWRRAEAETAWMTLHRDFELPVHIFRLAGIYGPGRSTIDNVRDGTARRIDKPGFAFSRIHVDDIVQVLDASMEHPNPGTIYNVCDDEAAEQKDVVSYACQLLKVTPPAEIPFDEAVKDMSDMAKTFWQDNRRIDNTRIKDDLAVRLKYPTYREGLRGVLDAESQAEKSAQDSATALSDRVAKGIAELQDA